MQNSHSITWSFNYVVFSDHMINQIRNFSICTIPLPAKRSNRRLIDVEMTSCVYWETWQIVYLFKGLSTIKLYNPLNKWLFEVMWQIKNIKSPVSQCRWSQDLARFWHTNRSSNSQVNKTMTIKLKFNHLTN